MMEQGREATDDFVEDLISDEPYAIGEVSAIVEKLTESFQELSKNLRKPNSTEISKLPNSKSFDLLLIWRFPSTFPFRFWAERLSFVRC
jgi:hypothetical protein